MARKRPSPPVPDASRPVADKAAKVKPVAPRDGGDPFALLRYEHRALDSLFTQFELRKERQLADRVCSTLTSHFRLEESFYREAETIPEIHGRVSVALDDHGTMEDQMRALGALDEGEALNDHMRTLQRAVEQHVREEERAIFPAVVKSLSRQRLRELGTSLRNAKDKLLEPSSSQRGEADDRHQVADEEAAVAS